AVARARFVLAGGESTIARVRSRWTDSRAGADDVFAYQSGDAAPAVRCPSRPSQAGGTGYPGGGDCAPRGSRAPPRAALIATKDVARLSQTPADGRCGTADRRRSRRARLGSGTGARGARLVGARGTRGAHALHDA